MGLFDDLKDNPELGNGLEDFASRLGVNEAEAPQTVQEYNNNGDAFAINAYDDAHTISLKRQGAALATEILISGGGQVAGAGATAATAGSIFGAPASPFVWIGTTFSSGYAGNVAAQQIEDPNGTKDFSYGRAIAAGVINTIPFVGKFTKGRKAARIGKAIAAQSAQGSVMATADTTMRVAIDENRLPTFEELKVAAGYGAGVGAVLGAGIEGAKPIVKEMTPQVKSFLKKIAGKSPEEVDAMVKKGELLPEEIDEAMDQINLDPNNPPKPTPESKIYRIPESELGDINQRTLQELSEDVDPEVLRKYSDQIPNHPDIVALRKQVDEIGETTLEKAGGKFDDNWQTERDWNGKVDELYGDGAPRKEKKALIIAGGSASGKSTIADQDAESLGAKIIDSDFAKELLPEFDGGRGAGIVHIESKAINKLVLNRALDNGDNIILPVVGSSGSSILKTIQALKDEGYEIAFKYVDIPVEVAQVRNFRRIHRTGRFVDPDYVTQQYSKISKNYETGKSNSTHSQRVTNERNTVEVLEQSGNWKTFFDSSGDVLTGRPVRGEDDGRVDTRETSQAQEGRADPPDLKTIQEAIDETESILVNQKNGRGYNVTRKVKAVFRAASKELFDDLSALAKSGDIEVAKRLLARLPKYRELDSKISQKDFAQGTSLKANDKNAQLAKERLNAGITSANNERAYNLRKLEEMLEDFVGGEDLQKPLLDQTKKQAKDKADGVRLTKQEKIDLIKAHALETFAKERTGTLQRVLDAYFSVRLIQLLNSFKTATVGTVSAIAQTVLRPVVNTAVNTRKLIGNPALKNKSISRKVRYALADLIATQEYIYMITKHFGNVRRSVFNTIRNRGDSAFLYLDKHSYVQGDITEARQLTRSELSDFRQAKRRNDARVQPEGKIKTALDLKAKILNSPLTKAPLFFYDYGLALIGGFEEISLIAHSLRAQRARGIKKGIEEGAEDLTKYADDYVESTIDRSTGTFRARYDAEFADDFNYARKDHFRRLDIDTDDIRQKGQWDEAVINTLQKMSSNPDEVGVLIKILYPILGVPMRALSYATKYTPPVGAYKIAKSLSLKGLSAVEKQTGDGIATFGKYENAITNLEADIKAKRKIIKDPSSTKDEIADAKRVITDSEVKIARYRDYQITEDYETLAIASLGFGVFVYGYQAAKQGGMTGTQAFMTDEQKKALRSAQGDPQPYRIEFGDHELDYRYLDPIKAAQALGADWANYTSLKEQGLLSEEQQGIKGLQLFATKFAKAMIQDMPTSRGVKNMANVFSSDPERQERGVADILSSTVPIPAEIRRFNTFDDEFMYDRTQGNQLVNAVDQAMGVEAANYRRTWMGERKQRDAETISSYFFTMGKKKPVDLEPIDKIYLEDAILQNTISATPTTFNGLKLKNYRNENGQTLYDFYADLISTQKIGGLTLRQRLNNLVKTPSWKTLYKQGYSEDLNTGQTTNPAVEKIKEVVSQYRLVARDKILKKRIAQRFYDGADNIYTEMESRKKTVSSQPDVLELLNLD